jgi:hypothetical protein
MLFNIGAGSWGVGATSLRRNIFVSVPSRSERDVADAPTDARPSPGYSQGLKKGAKIFHIKSRANNLTL